MVEGKDDLHSVVGLMRAHVHWPHDKLQVPVYIQDSGSKEAILEEGYIAGLLKERNMRVLGVMLDADDDASACYARARGRCSTVVPDMPADLPAGGLIVESDGYARLGVWIMPDNAARGDLETFLRHLVPDRLEPVWTLATQATAKAKELGAEYLNVHRAKAEIHTWLAWQEPPGRPFGTALTAKVLDPHSPYAASFVRWFRALYDL